MTAYFDFDDCLAWACDNHPDSAPPFGWNGFDQRGYCSLHFLALAEARLKSDPSNFIFKVKYCAQQANSALFCAQDDMHGETFAHLCVWNSSTTTLGASIPFIIDIGKKNRRDESAIELCQFLMKSLHPGSNAFNRLSLIYTQLNCLRCKISLQTSIEKPLASFDFKKTCFI